MKKILLPPPFLFRNNLLPEHITNHGEYDDFYHRYLGKQKYIKKSFWLLMFHLPLASFLSYACYFFLTLQNKEATVISSNYAGILQFLVISGLLYLLTAVYWGIVCGQIKSIVYNFTQYQKYKKEVSSVG